MILYYFLIDFYFPLMSKNTIFTDKYYNFKEFFIWCKYFL